MSFSPSHLGIPTFNDSTVDFEAWFERIDKPVILMLCLQLLMRSIYHTYMP